MGLVTPKTNVQLSYGYRSLSVIMKRHSSDFGVNWLRMMTLNRFSVLNCWRLVAVLFLRSSSLRRLIVKSFSMFLLPFVFLSALSAARAYSLTFCLRTSFFYLSASSDS